jgi:hypothetical protein
MSASTLPPLALAVACGRAGPPLPPIRLTPQAPSDLRLAQRGDRIEVRLRAPRVSVDGARLGVLDIELFITTSPGDLTKTVAPRVHRMAPGEAISEQIRPLPQPGTTLRAAARARLKKRFSAPTAVVSLEIQTPPVPARNVLAERAASGVRITWKRSGSAAPGSLRYWVYRRAPDGAYDVPLNAEPTSELAIEDESAEARAAVCYVVRAVAASNPVVESADSTEQCLVKRPPPPPPAPHGLVAVPRGADIELSWSCATEPGVIAHRVYRADDESAPARRAEIEAGRCAYRDQDVPVGAALHYTLTSVDGAGNESVPVSFGALRPRTP